MLQKKLKLYHVLPWHAFETKTLCPGLLPYPKPTMTAQLSRCRLEILSTDSTSHVNLLISCLQGALTLSFIIFLLPFKSHWPAASASHYKFMLRPTEHLHSSEDPKVSKDNTYDRLKTHKKRIGKLHAHYRCIYFNPLSSMFRQATFFRMKNSSHFTGTYTNWDRW